MNISRKEKINKKFQKAFADFIEKESNKESLVTVIKCNISSNLKNITVYISVLPIEKEDKVIEFLKRRKWDARDYIKKKVITKIIPFVNFSLDYGEKNRQYIDQLLKADTLNNT